MAITYANFFHHFTHAYEVPFPDHHVLLYDLTLERSGYSVFDRIRTLDPTLRNSSCVVVRGRGQEFLDRVRDDKLFHEALHSVPRLALVGSLANGAIELIQEPPFRPPDFAITLAELRAVEIKAILDRNGAMLGPHERLHYEVPSSDHAEAFLRIANALQEPVEVSRLSDWIFPYLCDHCGIVADNGTLLPLLLSLKGEAHRLYRWDIPIRTIEGYPAETDDIQEIANDLVRELGPTGRILFIVSVSGSGKLKRAIERLLLPLNYSVIVICDTAVTPGAESLVHVPIERWPTFNGKCSVCDLKDLQYIHKTSYVTLPTFATHRVVITPSAAERKADFWAAAERTNAVRLHHDLILPDRTLRHYGIYIDVVALLQDAWFRDHVITELRNFAPPTIVLIPRHRASETVQQIVDAAFGKVETRLLDPGDLAEDIRHRLSCLSNKDSILVADDGLVSGTTLYNVRPLIHRLYKKADAMPAIRAFVVVARPSRRAAMTRMRNRYRDHEGPQFRAGYELLLPDHRDCSWCRERTLLQNAVKQLDGQAQEACHKRISQLSGALRAQFLLGSDEQDTESRSVGSLFGSLGQATAFAAAACAIYEQWLEATGDEEDAVGSNTAFYVDVPRLINNYFADAFMPAVFRTMKPKALHFVGQNAGIANAIELLEPDSAYPCIVPEILWAAVENKIPHDVASQLLGKVREKTPEIILLEKLLRH
jgi:hypothetical protein